MASLEHEVPGDGSQQVFEELVAQDKTLGNKPHVLHRERGVFIEIVNQKIQQEVYDHTDVDDVINDQNSSGIRAMEVLLETYARFRSVLNDDMKEELMQE